MDRARELQQARRIEAEANNRATYHVPECGECYDYFIVLEPGARPCGAYRLMVDQADVAADRVDELAAQA